MGNVTSGLGDTVQGTVSGATGAVNSTVPGGKPQGGQKQGGGLLAPVGGLVSGVTDTASGVTKGLTDTTSSVTKGLSGKPRQKSGSKQNQSQSNPDLLGGVTGLVDSVGQSAGGLVSETVDTATAPLGALGGKKNEKPKPLKGGPAPGSKNEQGNPLSAVSGLVGNVGSTATGLVLSLIHI